MQAEMIRIRTNDGQTVNVEASASAADIAAIKAAPEVRFREFHYTGNHPRGENNGNYDDMEQWFRNAGLTIRGDDLTILLYNIEQVTGISELRHRGKTIRFHVQAHKGQGHRDMGYTSDVSYRLIRVR